jgi:hypothetical protein
LQVTNISKGLVEISFNLSKRKGIYFKTGISGDGKADELAKHNFRVSKTDGIEPVHDYIFFCGNGTHNRHLGTFRFVHKRNKISS